MKFTELPNLITSNEDKELYKCQSVIMKSHNLSDEDKLIRLAILQTLSPIEDWENASELVKSNVHTFNEFNLILSAFISLTAFELTRYESIEYFMMLLNERMQNIHGDLLSVAHYINAKYIIENNGDISYALSLLKKSVDECHRYVMNYIELSKYADTDLKKQYYQYACANVQNIYDYSNIKEIDVWHLIEPTNFFNEKIVRTDINGYAYEELIRLSQ